MRRDRAAGACARFGAHLSGEEEKRLERLQSEDEALHEAVEAARHACACLRIGGLSAVPSKGAVSSTVHAGRSAVPSILPFHDIRAML